MINNKNMFFKIINISNILWHHYPRYYDATNRSMTSCHYFLLWHHNPANITSSTLSSITSLPSPSTMTSQLPLLWRHNFLNYDVTTSSTMTSQLPLLWRHNFLYYDVTTSSTMTSQLPLLWRQQLPLLWHHNFLYYDVITFLLWPPTLLHLLWRHNHDVINPYTVLWRYYTFQSLCYAVTKGNLQTKRSHQSETSKAGTRASIFRGTRVLIFRGTRASIFRGTRVLIFRGTRASIFRGTRVLIFLGTRASIFRGTRVLIFRGTRVFNIPRYEGVNIPGYEYEA